MAKRKPHPLVAIVEDDAGVREATASLLEAAGFNTVCYEDAESFLRSPRGQGAGCLILDMCLPGMSGLQLYRKLIEQGIRVPAILLTARRDSGRRLHAEVAAAGMLGILHKPFDGEALIQLLQRAL